MTAQPLFGDPQPSVKLGPRQRVVLAALQARGELRPDEAGALAHAARGSHPEDARCEWCTVDGRDVLNALRRKGLARREGGVWLPAAAADAGHDPASSPWPDGF